MGRYVKSKYVEISIVLEFMGTEKEAKKELEKLENLAKSFKLKTPTPNTAKWSCTIKGLGCYVWAYQGKTQNLINFLKSVERFRLLKAASSKKNA